MPGTRLLAPVGGKLTPRILNHALSLAGEAAVDCARLSPRQMARAYDWAMREHLNASDTARVKRRPKPRFLDFAHA